jgi:hypothetical protein
LNKARKITEKYDELVTDKEEEEEEEAEEEE